ncbi:GNAT family N-acetyltransferase [Blautia marasmi]|uniref:GNAT family N-acetyltransferase n=1 Tax=Blautia marasmi TaxID=1917868 RepID=UPI000CF24C39|nr:GNAT family N-acetyltransferase [Blautia marasmi]
MNIDTKRLRIIPLTPHQLALWINDMPQLENELGCSYQAEPMDGIFKEIVSAQLAACEKDTENYIWHSFWFIIRNSDRAVVGSACFKNIPDTGGEVEIGYGLGKAFEQKGYMSEAVEAMCNWALGQKGVRHIIAETDLDGSASQKLLQKCGFTEYTRDKTIWWRL